MKQTQLALRDAAEWLGDWHPLAEQLGSAEGLVELGSVSALLRLKPVRTRASLRRFLQNYKSELLLPLELPAIQNACEHARRNEVRELIAQDQALRELERIVQRYLHAVETGEAHGWHTLVYGVTLAIYSLPMRQGLLGYAHQTLRGFIYSAARSLRLSEHDCRDLFESLCADLPDSVEGLIRPPVPA
jgi:UreF-like urease accessory protein